MSGSISPFKMEQAMSALMQAQATLLAADPDLAEDEAELFRLMADTSGNAIELLHRVVRTAIMFRDRAAAADTMTKSILARRDRYTRRYESFRAMALNALQALDQPRLEAPDFLAFRRRSPPTVTITDEASVPMRFIRTKVERSLDKTALKVALTDGEVIDGAMLSNGGESITIKTS